MLKRIHLIPVIVFLLIAQPVLAQSPAGGFSEPVDKILKTFKNPGKEFGSAPLWVWNTKVTREIIDTMMTDFKQKGFGGVFVHPRPGLITEYLSDDWMAMYAYTIKKAKDLDMNVWIYDENSYPTGFAGGLVPDQMPESYNQGQMLQLTVAEKLPENTKGVFICLKKEGDSFTDISKDLDSYLGKPGSYYIFNRQYYAKQAGMVGPPDFPLVDLLVKGVTEKFIDITLEKYKKAFGNDFGKTIPGTFSDEPSIPVHGNRTVRWTPDLFSTYQKRWGYDLVPHLASLYEETGDWKRLRHNYQQTLLEMFIDRWSKPMSAFAEKNNLHWTGHYWEHGWPNPSEGPDNMAMYAYHQVPGIDMLFNQFDEKSPNAQFGNIRSVKELSSVANQLNRERTLSETYGGAGWDLTFKEMKRLGDWEYALGVNLMNQHLSWMTVAGVRKYDYPPTFSYQNSWWPYCKPLNDYFTRLSFALSRGKQQNPILVLEPTSTAWMYFTHGGKSNARYNQIGNSFQEFVTKLQKHHVDYDLGSENTIGDHGKVSGNRFMVGVASYNTVVIPPGMENINKNVFQLLQTFAANGGKIVLFEKLQNVDGASAGVLNQFMQNKKNIVAVNSLDEASLNHHFKSNDFSIELAAGDKGNLYHHRRFLKDGQLLFLTNVDMDKASAGSVTIKGVKEVFEMDLNTGNLRSYRAEKSNNGVTAAFQLSPAGSVLLFFSLRDGVGAAIPQYTRREKVSASPLVVQRPRYNTLMIDFCDLDINGKSLPETHVWQASATVFKENGFTRNPWQHQMQLKTSFVDRDTFSRGSGYSAQYKFYIDGGVETSQFKLVIEQPELWSSIRINGKPVKPVPGEWWMDKKFGVLAAGNLLKAGENIITLQIEPMSIYAEVGPVYVLGNFNLRSRVKGWEIVKPQALQPGVWKEQGLPTYGHGISYSKELTVTDAGQPFSLQLNGFKGTVAAVKVNGKPSGIIYSDPYSIELVGLKKGKNRVEVTVVGSLKNLLGPHYNNPRAGYMGPDSWSNIKEMIPGSSFSLLDYGLEGFDIFQLKK